jgi:hypothetical protein
MSKAKDTVEELRNKLFNRKQKETVEEEQQAITTTLSNVTYDVIQDPSTTSRQFLIVKIKYDLDTKQATVVEVRPFQDKAVGMIIIKDKESRKYLFEKNRSEK